MSLNWYYESNGRRIKIIKEYRKLITIKHLIPKQASMKICAKYNICRKTLYNYINKFKDIPIR